MDIEKCEMYVGFIMLDAIEQASTDNWPMAMRLFHRAKHIAEDGDEGILEILNAGLEALNEMCKESTFDLDNL